MNKQNTIAGLNFTGIWEVFPAWGSNTVLGYG